jgi:hypothetical protein
MIGSDGDYFVRIELRRRDSNLKAASLSVTQEAIDAFETIGQDALLEAVENAVVRMRIAIREEAEASRSDYVDVDNPASDLEKMIVYRATSMMKTEHVWTDEDTKKAMETDPVAQTYVKMEK